MRSLHTTTKSRPRSLQLEKARAQQQRPKAPKNKKESSQRTGLEQGRPTYPGGEELAWVTAQLTHHDTGLPLGISLAWTQVRLHN